MQALKWMMLIVMMAGLSACNTDPSTSVKQPMTIRPVPVKPMADGDGAIFHAANSRPLFEDRRARFVGDIITVTLVEKNTGTTNSADSISRTGSANVNIGTPTILGYTPKWPFRPPVPGATTGVNTSLTAASTIKSDNKNNDTNTNSFTGSIAVTVIDVLPNGNLSVSGEKQIAVNENTEFIRLSGIVNPTTISASNTVSSTQIADARIETKQKQSVDKAMVLSMLSRFFVTLLPF